MVPFPADGCESNLDLPSHDRQGRGSGPEPSTHGSNTQSLMSHHVSVDPRLVRSDLGHRQANPEINSQSDSFSSGASQRYLSSNTALSAPGDVDIALYSSPLDSQTASGQANASLDSAYSQTAGMSLQTPLHHFPISTQIHGQEDHTQALGSGYNCSFSPAHAPQFGLEPSAQYAISGSSSLEPIAHEASVPLPTSGHSQPARYLPTSDLAYQQQAQSKGKASEADGSADGGRKRKKSKNPNMEVTSESESLEFDGGDERGSRPPGKQSRRKFSTDARRETAETRKTGACIRCRLQRSRCVMDPDDPTGECRTCQNVSKESRKVVHKLPCLRYKITEIRVSRADDDRGSLGLTKRWHGFDMKDIDDWVTPECRTIQLSLGVCSTPITIRVRKFRPIPGDVTYRCWRDGNVTKKTDIEPYALENIRESAKDVIAYLYNNAVKSLVALSKDESMSSITRETYRQAVQHYNALRVPELPDSQQREEWLFLTDVYRLWMAVRYTVGSSYVSGDDTLGMSPKLDDKSYPLWGRVSTPRMIIAQIDSINAQKILAPLRQRVLKTLETLIKANKTQHWFTIYIAIFLLLHNVSIISADRRRHGKANGATKGYSLPQVVEDLHEGANVLLAYWHYYRTDEDPLEVDPIDRHRSRLADLGAEQFSFVKKSCAVMREKREEFRRYPNWDDELYWVCRMFDKVWSPGESFRS
ncbi:hypothetical protein VUR80DRAFT_4640 [Thermomyces stellatus]